MNIPLVILGVFTGMLVLAALLAMALAKTAGEAEKHMIEIMERERRRRERNPDGL